MFYTIRQIKSIIKIYKHRCDYCDHLFIKHLNKYSLTCIQKCLKYETPMYSISQLCDLKRLFCYSNKSYNYFITKYKRDTFILLVDSIINSRLRRCLLLKGYGII